MKQALKNVSRGSVMIKSSDLHEPSEISKQIHDEYLELNENNKRPLKSRASSLSFQPVGAPEQLAEPITRQWYNFEPIIALDSDGSQLVVIRPQLLDVWKATIT